MICQIFERIRRSLGSTALVALASLFACVPGEFAWAQDAAAPVAAAAPADAGATPPAAASADAAVSTYVIGPGDVLQIFVWRNPELSATLPVRPDGRISTPLIEDIVAVGKTPVQLARDMEKVLSEYIRSPQVNVIVSQAQNALNQVKVLGQVAKPTSIAFREGMTVLDAVLEVGGLSPFAAGNRTRILRKTDKGVEQVIKVKLDSLLKKGRAGDNPKLKPGDVIVVPESLF